MSTPRSNRPHAKAASPIVLLLGLLLVGLGGLGAPTAARADGFIYVHEPVVEIHTIPRPRHWRVRRVRPHFPLQITRHKVDIDIAETVARTRVEETFHNPGGRQLEGTYLFPLPEGGVISNFSMKIGGKEVAGEVLERDKARKIYEDIVRRAKDPGLLEYVKRGLFKARVFPIPPRGDVEVAIEYTESLSRTQGLTSYRYPLDTGKYSSAPYRNVVVDVKLTTSSALRSIHCPSHRGVGITRKGDKEARITFEAKELEADKDFVLSWNVSTDEVAPFILTHRGHSESAHFFISLRPSPAEPKVVPKDVVFVVDTSGSMVGAKLEQVQKALKYCIHNLNDGDRFNLVDFSTEARRFRESLVSVSDETRKAGDAYVAQLKARGGTNIEQALRFALDDLISEDRLQLVVFLTDGEPTIGPVKPEEILRSVKESNRHRRRVFVFGVGDDLNTTLMDRLAKETSGVTQYIAAAENIEVPLSNFYDKIDSPVFTDLELNIVGEDIADVYPKALPDLFHGEQLEIFGRYKTHGKKTVVLKGKLQGEMRAFEYSLDFSGGDHPFIPTLWAQRKIGYLLEQMRLSGESKEVKDEVVRLSKHYGILTPYTSYLVVEEAELASADGSAVRLNEFFAAPYGAVRRSGRGRSLERARLAFRDYAGADAVRASKSISRLKSAVSGGIQAESLAGEPDQDAAQQSAFMRSVGSWKFYLQGDRWIDATLTDRDVGKLAKVRRVKYLSDEYFALLSEAPELGKALSVGPQVSFLWKGEMISIDAE